MLKSFVPPAEIDEGGERVTTESEWIGCFGAKRERSNCSKIGIQAWAKCYRVRVRFQSSVRALPMRPIGKDSACRRGLRRVSASCSMGTRLSNPSWTIAYGHAGDMSMGFFLVCPERRTPIGLGGRWSEELSTVRSSGMPHGRPRRGAGIRPAWSAALRSAV